MKFLAFLSFQNSKSTAALQATPSELTGMTSSDTAWDQWYFNGPDDTNNVDA